MKWLGPWVALALGIGMPAARPAVASDGRIEINAARAAEGGVTASDTPGFPVTLGSSGSYVLTGDLAVPLSTSGLEITAPDVSVDLNGFAIRSTFLCSSGSCAAGTGAPSGIVSLAESVSVRGGAVRGFAGDCIVSRGAAHLSGLWVRDCARNGIRVAAGSLVLENRVERVGTNGIAFDSAGLGIARGNEVSQTDLASLNGREIAGGVATGGNLCDEGGCSARGKRRFYLGASLLGSVLAPTACLAGFHMASAFELLDPGGLEYVSRFGVAAADGGSGPPAGLEGRVRTGQTASTVSNCSAWTSSNPAHTGTHLMLEPSANWNAAGSQHSPWRAVTGRACSQIARVWCIED
jgi:hypothetical protein